VLLYANVPCSTLCVIAAVCYLRLCVLEASTSKLYSQYFAS